MYQGPDQGEPQPPDRPCLEGRLEVGRRLGERVERPALVAEANRLFGDDERPTLRLALPEGGGGDYLLARLRFDWAPLGIKVERRMNDRTAMDQLGDQLRKRFPQSKERQAYDRGAFDE